MTTSHRIEQRVALVCILCARVAGTVQAGVLRPRPDVDAAFLARRVCPDCGGRLWAQDAEPVLVLLKLPPEEAQPKRGRPPKPSAPRRPSDRLCADCELTHIQAGRTRCRACDAEHRRAVGLAGRLVELLRCSEPIKTRHLATMLGTKPDVVRQVVRKARLRGVPIVNVGKRYRLETAS